MKTCVRCHKEKPLSEFFKHKQQKSGLDPKCKICASKAKRESYLKTKKENPTQHASNWRQYRKNYKTKHPERHKRSQQNQDLKKKYGITIEEFESLLKAQGNCCAICKTPKNGRRFAVDHDHQTGIIRGILCDGCNIGIGHLKESPKILQAAIKYLR
jgi:hypothetical protein